MEVNKRSGLTNNEEIEILSSKLIECFSNWIGTSEEILLEDSTEISKTLINKYGTDYINYSWSSWEASWVLFNSKLR